MVIRRTYPTSNDNDPTVIALREIEDISKDAITVQSKDKPSANGWGNKTEAGHADEALDISQDPHYSSETDTKPPSVDNTNCSSNNENNEVQGSPGGCIPPATISSLLKPPKSIEVSNKDTIVVRSGVSHSFGGWLYNAKVCNAVEDDNILSRPRYTNLYVAVDLELDEILNKFNGWEAPSVRTKDDAFTKLQTTIKETLNPLERAYPDLKIRYEPFESGC